MVAKVVLLVCYIGVYATILLQVFPAFRDKSLRLTPFQAILLSVLTAFASMSLIWFAAILLVK